MEGHVLNDHPDFLGWGIWRKFVIILIVDREDWKDGVNLDRELLTWDEDLEVEHRGAPRHPECITDCMEVAVGIDFNM